MDGGGATATAEVNVTAAGSSISGDFATSPDEFVGRLYEKVLGRPASAEELRVWADKLISGEITGSNAAYGFFFSDEFKSKNCSDDEFIDLMYEVILGRPASANEEAGWLDMLENGKSRSEVFAGFVNSREFKRTSAMAMIDPGEHVHNDSAQDFVHRFYKVCLNRNPEAEGLRAWSYKLLSQESSGADVAKGIIFSDEFRSKNYTDAEFVDLMYRAFLGRGADPAGYTNWMNLLNTGSRDDVVDGFINSQEFVGLCAGYNIRPY